jgi:hypothetical protein
MKLPSLRQLGCALVGALAAYVPVRAADSPPTVYNVRAYGAIGDGRAIDSPAINRAIDAAAAAGGGQVLLPPGNYLSYTIRLKSNIDLHLARGATLIAADQPAAGQTGYDPHEPNRFSDLVYQDFGHGHWQNSLIWGENLDQISITGDGRIWGRGLLRNGGETQGQGNKSIALKLCRNVDLRDFSVLQGGWFVLLATGVDNLTISNVKVDTNRDGFDIDCCRNVRITDCTINSPLDDAIVLKSSYGLGFARSTDNVTITGCQVSGYTMGTFFDGTYQPPANGGGTGRIKFGTESNGGFRNITIANCIFVHCNGLAIESVDGAIIEDVTISNLAMEHITNPPIFVRLGARMRGPEGIPVGVIRRLNINNVVVGYGASRAASIISGIPGHPVEDISLSHIRILYTGGDGPAGVALPNASAQQTAAANLLALETVALRTAVANARNALNAASLSAPAEIAAKAQALAAADQALAAARAAGYAKLQSSASRLNAAQKTALVAANGSPAATAPATGAAGRTGGRGTGLPSAGPDPFGVPELEDVYPEPTMFGNLPAYGFYLRHVRDVSLDHVDLSLTREEYRPPILLHDVAGARFEHMRVQAAAGVPVFMLSRVTDFATEKFTGLAELRRDQVDRESISGAGLPAPGSTYQPAAPAENVPESALIPIRPSPRPL